MEKPIWVKHTPQQVTEIIIQLAKENTPTEKIGLILRDTYGIPKAKLLGLKISKVINQELGKKTDSSLTNMSKNVEQLKKHLSANKQDKKAKQTLIKKTGLLIKLKKHYAKEKV
ncbi:MAG: hypothetical protein AABX65_04740 [Nanoarchaeota archaeon]|mgnify:CR=1 FL=1